MIAEYSMERLKDTPPDELGDRLERGEIVYFPECPVTLPDTDDLNFVRDELPELVARKNISYHPETDRVKLKGAPELADRARGILKSHSDRIVEFLHDTMPSLTSGCTIGTSSFRPIQEKGRDLSPHSSNELVHIDAGAYGATNGDRILRFFINANPTEDRVWATKGQFSELYPRFGSDAGITPPQRGSSSLDKRAIDHAFTAFLRGLAHIGLPQAVVVDSSPYDRTMRKFHNFMKDTPSFQQDMSSHQEIRFPPFSAWMVFTDTVSHASVSGQHAFVNTFLIRLARCRYPDLAPYNILTAA